MGFIVVVFTLTITLMSIYLVGYFTFKQRGWKRIYCVLWPICLTGYLILLILTVIYLILVCNGKKYRQEYVS